MLNKIKYRFLLLPSKFKLLNDLKLRQFKYCLPFLLFFATVYKGYSNSQALEATKDSILGWRQKVVETRNFVDNLLYESNWKLPVGVRKVIGTTEYQVIVDKIYTNKRKRYFNASVVINFPESNQPLFFRGTHLPLGKKGLISGSAKLSLLGNETIQLNDVTTLEILTENQKTFVEIECGGYKQMGIEGKYTFSSNWLVSENPDGSPNPAEPVTATFATQVVEWGDMVTSLQMSPFQIKGLEGFTIVPTNVSMDKSDLKNPYNIQFPANYLDMYYGGFGAESWTGIHIESAQLKLPKKLSPKNGERRSISTSQLLLDDQGFTGTLGASNILNKSEGSIDTWPFSIDSLNIQFFTNQLRQAQFTGKLTVPIFKDRDLDYVAAVGLDDLYFFSVSNLGNAKVPMWAADMEIYENSSIEIESINGEFRAAAVLNGQMNVQAGFNGKEGSDLQLAGVGFENLRVQSYQPYIKLGQFSFNSSTSNGLANFPFAIQNVKAVEEGNKTGIQFDGMVQFMGKEDKGFGGRTNVTLWSRTEDQDAIIDFVPAGVQVNEVEVDVDGGAFEFYGLVQIYRQDPVFGRGFKGQIEAKFLPGIEASATAQFGNVDGFAYWYVDAALQVPGGIPLGPGLGCYGFAGAARFHMKAENFVNAAFAPTESISASNKAPTESTIDNQEGLIEYAEGEVGATRSGINYVPDRRTGLGLKAKVVIGTHPTPVAFNGDCTFEIEFYAGGGISKVQFVGDAYFMTPLEERKNPKVRATLTMSFVTEGSVFHASLDTYFNLGAVKGSGSGGYAGRAEFYTAKNEGWYLYIGTPSKPISLYFLSVLKTKSYFMMGTKIEGFPDPPDEVGNILGEMNTSLMRNENQLENAGGFAFGSSLYFDTGDITFLLFYGRVRAASGFDIMLVNYGSGVECKGRSGSIGLNGWYAAGQAWAYLQAQVGVKINLKLGFVRIKKKIPILDVGAAAILQAKLPNPTYMRGMIGGYFSVLGGLVKGRIKFKFELGDECQVVGANPLLAMPIIRDVNPREGDQDVSVFTVAQATLNMPVNKPFEMFDQNDNLRYYRVKLDFIRISNGDQIISGTYTLNETKDVVAFKAFDVLPPETKLKLEAQVSFEEWKDGGWKKVIEDGKVVVDAMETTFTTGDAPDHIPASNVVFSYPIANQMHFHPKETINAYIKLRMGQPYLFENAEGKWQQQVRYKNPITGQSQTSPVEYNSGTRMIHFNVPQSMPLDQIYHLELVTKPTQSLGAIDQNISVSNTKLGEGDLSEISQRSSSIDGNLEALQETELFAYHFKTSRYATFKEKMQNFNALNEGWWWPIQTGVHKIGINLRGEEYFDKFEINGGANFDQLIYFEADPNNYWVRDVMTHHVYKPYPVNGLTISNRNTDKLGIIPLKAVGFHQYPDQAQLNEADPTSGPFSIGASFTAIDYLLPVVSYYDMYDLQQQAALQISREKEPAPILFDYLSRTHKPIGNGHYDVRMQYVLPGINKVTSSHELKIQINKL